MTSTTDGDTDSSYNNNSDSDGESSGTPPPPANNGPATTSKANGTSQSSGAGLLDPTLSRARRRKLDIINKLLSLGANLDIDVPQIVVIGSQSAGKSSLIESISGIKLPRSSGTCTRCPTECLLMRSDKPWECQVSLRFFTDASGATLQTVRNVGFGTPIRDPDDVEERIRRAQRAVLNPDTDPQDFLVGNSSKLPQKNALDFTTNCVSLEIKGPDVADLSFCDLPGLIASVSGGGRVEDIAKVRMLVESYISKPSCIVLLTVACESDFETQGAYQLAKQHDPEGERTIGVLTKPDRIPPGAEESWIALIKNDKSSPAPLVNGWYSVKQPSSSELKEEGLTFMEARRRGEAYFQKPPWSTLDVEHRNKLGTQALTLKLHEYLMETISKRLPELMKELEKILQRTKDELQKLPAPTFKDPVMEVMHIISDFSDDMFRHAEGLTYTISGSPEAKGGNQFESIRDSHEIFRQRIRSTAPNFRPFNASYVNAESMNVEPPFLSSEEKGLTFLRPPIFLDDVVNRVRKATTRELPSYFSFQVLQDLISCSSSQWEQPALVLANSIYWIVLEHHNKLIELHFGKYTAGGLRQSVSKIIQEYTQNCKDEAIERMKWLLEIEAHAFTLNQHYLEDYRNKFQEFYKNRRLEHIRRYPAEPLNSSGIDIMATVRAYFQVAYKRVVDTLPLAIDHELVRVKKRNVQDAISSGLKITGAQAHKRCERFLAEPSEVVRKREELRGRLERLTKAQSELMDA